MPVRLSTFHYDAAVLNSQCLRCLYAQSNKFNEARLIISRNYSAPSLRSFVIKGRSIST
jgi:hypothetical protein